MKDSNREKQQEMGHHTNTNTNRLWAARVGVTFVLTSANPSVTLTS